MPGNKLYRISRLSDDLKRFWYWGTIGSLKYHMALTDKYLVEAKTLFEYKQYPYAIDALGRSDKHFLDVIQARRRVKSENKEISSLRELAQSQQDGHVTVLMNLMRNLPKEYLWQPEKESSQLFNIEKIFSRSIETRNNTN